MKQFIIRSFFLLFMISTLQAAAQTWGDYTFYCPKSGNKGYLIDMSGAVYHTWTFQSGKPTGYSSYLLPGGVVLRTVIKSGNYFTGGPICGEVQKIDWNGNVIWDFVYSTTEYCSHHDICPMPNGNVLLIAYESKTPAQVTQAGCSQSITMWPDKIVEIQPSGATGGIVVWEWKVWDHLCQTYNAAKDNYVSSIVQNPGLLNINYNTQKDWMHVNGVDYNATLDQVAFSSHNMNEFYVIDHSTTTAQAAGHTGGNAGKGGDFLYRWGNPAAYQASGATIFNVVHDAHWVPEDCPKANYLVGFNNKGGAGMKNCIDFVNPPYSGNGYAITVGSAFQPPTYDWRHTYSGTPTQNEGQSQQLPNGNSLITISLNGYIYEIDSNQTVVWSKTVSGGVTNARRYTACYVNGASTVAATSSVSQGCAGISVQLTATPSGGTGNTYAWTSIPAGFTSTLQNPVVSPTVTTSYIVTMTSGTCTDDDTVTVTITPQPTVLAGADPPQVCLAGTSQLSATPSGTANYTYAWTSVPPGFSSAVPNPVVGPAETTLYIVGIAADGCQASDSVVVTVYETPAAPVITLTGDSLMSGSVTGNQWFLNGDLITGATGQYLVPGEPGTYQVQVTSPEGCVSPLSDPFVYVGLGEAATAGNIMVFPNPTTGIVHIRISGLENTTYVTEIFNTLGRLVLSSENQSAVDLSGLAPGVYYLSIRTDATEFTTKKLILIK